MASSEVCHAINSPGSCLIVIGILIKAWCLNHTRSVKLEVSQIGCSESFVLANYGVFFLFWHSVQTLGVDIPLEISEVWRSLGSEFEAASGREDAWFWVLNLWIDQVCHGFNSRWAFVESQLDFLLEFVSQTRLIQVDLVRELDFSFLILVPHL